VRARRVAIGFAVAQAVVLIALAAAALIVCALAPFADRRGI
jgi:hypothetical protein